MLALSVVKIFWTHGGLKEQLNVETNALHERIPLILLLYKIDIVHISFPLLRIMYTQHHMATLCPHSKDVMVAIVRRCIPWTWKRDA